MRSRILFLGIILLLGFLFYHLINGQMRPKILPKVFIIGASTVRYDYDPARMGWGSALIDAYLNIPANGYNRARRGASSISYQVMNDAIRKSKGPYYWESTKRLIERTIPHTGSYLLIQFGANDKYEKRSKEAFQEALKFYITQARRMGVIPVLISPLETRLKIEGKPYHSRGEYPHYMRELAYQEQVLFLDLCGKSYKAYAKMTQSELDQKFGAMRYSNGRIDRTHLSPEGAKIVAGWVRDLACEKDQKLCSLFREEPR